MFSPCFHVLLSCFASVVFLMPFYVGNGGRVSAVVLEISNSDLLALQFILSANCKKLPLRENKFDILL